MKVKLNEILKSLDDKEMVGQDGIPMTVGKALANMLIAPRQSGAYEMDKIKLYILSQEMYTKDEMEIDEADMKHIRNIVETDSIYGPLVTGFVLLSLENKKVEDK